MENHLKDIIGANSSELREKKIVLCVSGSIAVIESPKLARILMRHGADVYVAMSKAAQKIIRPEALEWATGNPVITELSGKTEHIQFAGNWKGKADLVLLAPSTANTISKIANGIDDTVVTTIASTALGSNIPIILVPSMHESMYQHPVVAENIKKLESLGVEIIYPKLEEGKAKMQKVQEIAEIVIAKLSEKDMLGLKVIVTAGPTIEHIDPVRFITNKSSGKMGIALAREAYRRGAEVILIYGPGTERVPSFVETIRVNSTDEMSQAVVSNLKSNDCHMFVAAAAVADYTPEKKYDRKIVTNEVKKFSLELKATTKIIESVKKIKPDIFLIAFKAECNIEKKEFVKRAYEKLIGVGAELIVANDVCRKGVGIAEDKNEVLIIDKEKEVIHIPPLLKNEVAQKIFDTALSKFSGAH
ncbi:bifunctional phosphopantothenoylcysteine decarboxylase/phosphopantothenate--cysteine ligase CoaBC [Candidatus Pacearchaeota archaeon]|nr:bifunctional phosphopantothenoylcysteine decarboxylase/phosphopantothenate--cysteine ligase CoaBC [Candidatus Pacearchaeota archaeon]